MAMSVTVLCPNGRRVNVKATANTSILQIIEDACKKEKFPADDYDLKHLNRMLDTSSTVRYSNIPNKSQLELVKCAVPRTASNVTVNIATDVGARLVHDFPANTTLWDILRHHEQQGNDGVLIPPEEGESEAVIVYTMRRINGDQLKSTTLKSLGLTSGKCMLRHSIQKSSTTGQAHVSAPLSRPKPPKVDNNVRVPEVVHNDLVPNVLQNPLPNLLQQPVPNLLPNLVQEQPARIDPPAPPPLESPQRRHQNPQMDPPPIPPPLEDNQNLQLNHHGAPADIAIAEHPDVIASTGGIVPDVIQPQNGILQPDIVADKGAHIHHPMPMDILEGHEGASSSNYRHEQEEEFMQVEECVIKLGSHDAILFSMDDAPPSNLSAEDDGFFDLTVDEIKGLYREQQHILQTFDSAPLMTKQMRDMEESAKVLSALNQFPVTQLRIYFPDNNVIQGSFKPTATVSVVMDFLRTFLANPDTEFRLVMRHPTRMLSPEASLVASDCVPNARLYFESASNSPYLNDETLAKKSSFNSACGTLKSRRARRTVMGIASQDEAAAGSSSESAEASARNSEVGYQKRTNTNMQATGAVKKVPRWFRTGK